MSTLKGTGALAIVALGLALGSAPNASTYSYSGVITLCTSACDSFAALSVGTSLTGTLNINTTPGGSFNDTDMGRFTFFVFNPALPPSGPVGDPVNDNPLVLDSLLGIAVSNGTSGTTDAANWPNSGQVVLEFLVPSFSSNGAFVILDLATGDGQMCLFYATGGCIQGSTEFIRFEGSFPRAPIPATVWLFASALLGLGGLHRRKTAHGGAGVDCTGPRTTDSVNSGVGP